MDNIIGDTIVNLDFETFVKNNPINKIYEYKEPSNGRNICMPYSKAKQYLEKFLKIAEDSRSLKSPTDVMVQIGKWEKLLSKTNHSNILDYFSKLVNTTTQKMTSSHSENIDKNRFYRNDLQKKSSFSNNKRGGTTISIKFIPKNNIDSGTLVGERKIIAKVSFRKYERLLINYLEENKGNKDNAMKQVKKQLTNSPNVELEKLRNLNKIISKYDSKKKTSSNNRQHVKNLKKRRRVSFFKKLKMAFTSN